MYVLPGNHESESNIAAFCQKPMGYITSTVRCLDVDGWKIAGLGYSSPTPFGTPGEYSEAELAARLAPFKELSPLTLICHAPPKDTALDRVREGLHCGSSAVRGFIDQYQPAWFFCGHIHEAEGVVTKIGKTTAVNAGKRGYLLEL